MIKPRFIARLDIKNEYLIKSIQLEGLKKIGDPNEYAIKYYKAGVDEIIISSDLGQTQNEMIDSMHRIGEEVIPHFKKTNSQVA